MRHFFRSINFIFRTCIKVKYSYFLSPVLKTYTNGKKLNTIIHFTVTARETLNNTISPRYNTHFDRKKEKQLSSR